MEAKRGLKIASIEEIAYRQGLIDRAQLEIVAEELKKSSYGEYLHNILRQEI